MLGSFTLLGRRRVLIILGAVGGFDRLDFALRLGLAVWSDGGGWGAFASGSKNLSVALLDFGILLTVWA